MRFPELSNYEMSFMNFRNNIFLSLITLVSFFTVSAQESNVVNDSFISKKINLALSEIRLIPICVTKTKRVYELYLKLPDGYSENNETNYPVLYFTDAMWHIEILSGSSGYLMENLILVGISWKKEKRAEISRFRDHRLT